MLCSVLCILLASLVLSSIHQPSGQNTGIFALTGFSSDIYGLNVIDMSQYKFEYDPSGTATKDHGFKVNVYSGIFLS